MGNVKEMKDESLELVSGGISEKDDASQEFMRQYARSLAKEFVRAGDSLDELRQYITDSWLSIKRSLKHHNIVTDETVLMKLAEEQYDSIRKH